LPWRRFAEQRFHVSKHDLYQTRKAQQSRALDLERTWECKHYRVTTDTERVRTSPSRRGEKGSVDGRSLLRLLVIVDGESSSVRPVQAIRVFPQPAKGHFLSALLRELPTGRRAVVA
jgi:hypothetical protein